MSTYPNESWPSDAAVEALDGTTDAETGLPYIAKGTGPTSSPTYEVQYNRRQQRQNRILAAWRAGMVVTEGGLNIGVYPLMYVLGGVAKIFPGATGVSVPDDDTRVVYIDGNNTLQVQQTFPSDLRTFVPLAAVASSSGSVAVADHRTKAAFVIPEFTGSIGAGDLSTALADAVPDVNLTVGSETGDAIAVTVQVRDAAGNDLSEMFLLRCWLSDVAGGAETAAAPSGGVSFSPNTLLRTITANKHWLALTDSSGQTQVTLTETGAVTWYLNVVFDGRVYTSGAIAFA